MVNNSDSNIPELLDLIDCILIAVPEKLLHEASSPGTDSALSPAKAFLKSIGISIAGGRKNSLSELKSILSQFEIKKTSETTFALELWTEEKFETILQQLEVVRRLELSEILVLEFNEKILRRERERQNSYAKMNLWLEQKRASTDGLEPIEEANEEWVENEESIRQFESELAKIETELEEHKTILAKAEEDSEALYQKRNQYQARLRPKKSANTREISGEHLTRALQLIDNIAGYLRNIEILNADEKDGDISQSDIPKQVELALTALEKSSALIRRLKLTLSFGNGAG